MKTEVRVKCVDNYINVDLTKGKEYLVLSEKTKFFLIKNDRGKEQLYFKYRFKESDAR